MANGINNQPLLPSAYPNQAMQNLMRQQKFSRPPTATEMASFLSGPEYEVVPGTERLAATADSPIMTDHAAPNPLHKLQLMTAAGITPQAMAQQLVPGGDIGVSQIPPNTFSLTNPPPDPYQNLRLNAVPNNFDAMRMTPVPGTEHFDARGPVAQSPPISPATDYNTHLMNTLSQADTAGVDLSSLQVAQPLTEKTGPPFPGLSASPTPQQAMLTDVQTRLNALLNELNPDLTKLATDSGPAVTNPFAGPQSQVATAPGVSASTSTQQADPSKAKAGADALLPPEAQEAYKKPLLEGAGIYETSGKDYTGVGVPEKEPTFWESPLVHQALFNAAKALDPKGFGGTLAEGMMPMVKGMDYQDYVSDLLAGKDPAKIVTGRTLSPAEQRQAWTDVGDVARTDIERDKEEKIETPLQKLYRDLSKTALAGEYNKSTASLKLGSSWAQALKKETDEKTKKEVSEAYKVIQDVRSKLTEDMFNPDGSINTDALNEALFGGQKITTDADNESLRAAVDFLEGKGYEVLGMRNYLDATGNLTKPYENPLTKPAPVTPASVKEAVDKGTVIDNGDGSYTIKKDNRKFRFINGEPRYE